MIMFDLDKKELENMPKDDIVDMYITNVTIVNDNPEFQKYMSEEEDKKKIQNSLLPRQEKMVLMMVFLKVCQKKK